MTGAALIHRAEDLREGDIFLGPIGGLTGFGVRLGQIALGEGYRVGRIRVEHVAICTRGPLVHGLLDAPMPGSIRIAQAMPLGAEEVGFSWDKHWTDQCAWVRLPEDYPGQARDAAEVALAMVREKVGYSFMTYPALGALKLKLPVPGLHSWVDRRRPEPVRMENFGPADWPADIRPPRRAICSRLVDFAWTMAGHEVLERTRSGVATPGMMAEQFTHRQGVVWAMPRGLHLPARTWQV